MPDHSLAVALHDEAVRLEATDYDLDGHPDRAPSLLRAAAASLSAVDRLHREVPPHEDRLALEPSAEALWPHCGECRQRWPCRTHRTLHA